MTSKSEQRERTHAAILDSATRLLRRRGIGGMSVADVMGGAGLTVGGFYAHFASKEKLVERSLEAVLAQMRAVLFAGLSGLAPSEIVRRVVGRYLSRRHRDASSDGCALPALISEVASGREAAMRPVLGRELEAFVAAFADAVPGERARVRALALGCAALMVGGLTLARATSGSLSDEILSAARSLAAAALPEVLS
jgi:TetR/AcrR family transcriptional regulator, transcriptional repressor for nem operon